MNIITNVVNVIIRVTVAVRQFNEFMTLQVALFSVQWYFLQACSSMHFALSIDKQRL